MTAAARNIPWQVVDHIVLSPPAARLVTSSRHPRREHSDHERDAQRNREAVERWRKRQYDKKDVTKVNPRACCTTEYDADILNMLVGMGQILDHETGDPKIVGQAISDMLAEAAQAWKVR